MTSPRPVTISAPSTPAPSPTSGLPARPRRRPAGPAVRRPARWPDWPTRIALLLLAFGAYQRVFQWHGARSLWLDEALIARSLVSRDHVGLVAEPLRGDQAAPVLWLWASRLSIDVFGEGERALRLVPLLSGLVALGLGWRLARRLLPAVLVPVAVGLMVLSPSLLYYANEVKPYSLDVAVVLGLVLLALRVPPGAGPGPPTTVLAAAGAVAVWASFASVFALTGLSVALVLGALRAGGRKHAVRTAAVLSAWVVSLAVSYVAVLHRLSGSAVLSDYWADTFPAGPTDLPVWLLRRTVALLDDPLALGVPALALVLLAVGGRRVWRTAPRTWLLATAAVPVAVLAAALGQYPFAGRLALWTVPLAAIALAAVLPHRLDERPDRARAHLVLSIAGLLLVHASAAAETLPQAVRVQPVEELRPVLQLLAAQREPGDLVLVDVAATAPFDFYAARTGVRRDGVVLFVSPDDLGGRCNDGLALRTGRFASRRVWVVFAHRLADGRRLGTREDLLSRIGALVGVGRAIEHDGARALLFDPTAPRPPRTPAPRNDERCLAVYLSASPPS